MTSALAAVFLSASIWHLEQEEVAAGLRIFWLPLALSEQIEQLGSEGQRVFLLQNSRFDEENTNQTNCVLSRTVITKWSEQRANQFECVWNVWWGELSGLSGNPWAPACWNWTGLIHTPALPLATAVRCSEINLVLRMKSQPLQAPVRTHSSCNPRASSASLKIEKSACDQFNPARNPLHHTHSVELAAISA